MIKLTKLNKDKINLNRSLKDYKYKIREKVHLLKIRLLSIRYKINKKKYF